MELFPAIMIGGPPHAGKSVLAYSLTHALRQQGVVHYVLRAYPDGEGDWANKADQELVRRIRLKGQGTPQWVTHICRDIATRHLPLIVDVGGRPTSDQERIFDYCTHAILLTTGEDSHDLWETIVSRHGLIFLADLHSQLSGVSLVTDDGPLLRGVITGLERGAIAAGPTLDALVERIARLFTTDPLNLRRSHLKSAPVENAIDLDRLAHSFDIPFTGEEAIWEPRHLPRLLGYLPEATPLGLYGRGPNWIYAAVALLACPEPFYQFDPRLGWVTPPPLRRGSPAADAPLQVQVQPQFDHIHLAFALSSAHLDYSQAEGLTVPPVPSDQGIVLSGKLPLWLYTALALTYAPLASWLAVYQPQWGDQAIVVISRIPELALGHQVTSPPPTSRAP